MGTPRVSTFLIALIWISFFATVFASFLSNVSTNYAIDDSNIDLETYNKLEELNTQTKDLQNTTTNFKTQSGITDIIGDYFTNGYKAIKASLSSLDIFSNMITGAVTQEGVNVPALRSLETAIIATVTIFLIIGVLLSAILKKDV